MINQVWVNWREGSLADKLNLHHEVAWSLDRIEPPIFSHAPNGTCVVIGRRTKNWVEPNMLTEEWTGEFETADIIELRPRPKFKRSHYIDKLNRGCFFGPFHYFIVNDVRDKNEDIWSITTQIGSKAQWKGKYFEGEVEKDALLHLVTSKDLKPPFGKSRNYLIAPIENDKLMLPDKSRTKRYPKTDAFWRICNKEFKRLKGKGATELLEENYGYPDSLALQLKYFNRGKIKVVYNSSGTWLKASRISCKTIVASTCYWLICKSVNEAQYLVGVLNAPNMQDTWRQTKTSKMHFHTAPLQKIPVPQFDHNSAVHLKIASVIDRLERKKTTDLELLNSPVAKLLPEYVV